MKSGLSGSLATKVIALSKQTMAINAKLAKAKEAGDQEKVKKYTFHLGASQRGSRRLAIFENALFE